jgi:hypothetical protein
VEQESTEDGTRVRALMPPAAAARIRQALDAASAERHGDDPSMRMVKPRSTSRRHTS